MGAIAALAAATGAALFQWIYVTAYSPLVVFLILAVAAVGLVGSLSCYAFTLVRNGVFL